MADGRVSVGVGSHGLFTFVKMQAYQTCLAGMQTKTGALTDCVGRIAAIRLVPGATLPSGKPDFDVDIRTDSGEAVTVRRSNIARVVLSPVADATQQG